ncbi:hypothetical protein DL766_007369 [Monosporascus sp. MC13-8B]|uniref:DUF6594 domain-containing protein n=1 Tax=Monosporascus cannonballus TaxID=155416 RepID=A0ABY0GZ49_9PEZI|nr:hypothetical protein DL762_007625 [Monosporascus cannonballus]RYO85238.1 hypothetical protein DL763_007179 [Monosporascus cannonballus]RYP24112.1 hypothetical protein DL766_007369 [Monosporascus sp. MC13-8B]
MLPIKSVFSRVKESNNKDANRDRLLEGLGSLPYHERLTRFIRGSDIAASRLDDGPGSRLQAALIWDHGLRAVPSHQSLFQDSDILGSFDPNLMQHSTAIGRSLGREREEAILNDERLARLRTTLKRLMLAIIGGLIIVVPMFILVEGDTTVKTLVVITTSILLFAIGVAVLSQAAPESLLAATAAYAAVLVTLIGDGSKGLSMNNNEDVMEKGTPS